MKKTIEILTFALLFTGPLLLKAQTFNNNQQQININVPVIEKPVYIERYRTVYVEKPRVARRLDKPVLLLGYLWVYPEDLGNFKQIPVGVINSVNAQRPYGRDNWRIPTPDELAVLEANADKIGLGDDIYLATDHCNGVLRLVAVEGEVTNCVKVGGTYWMKTNLGAATESDKGSLVTIQDAIRFCPNGYRLPTKEEFEELMALGNASFGGYFGSDRSYATLYFPNTETHRESYEYDLLSGYQYYTIEEGSYWILNQSTSGYPCYFDFSYNVSRNKVDEAPQFRVGYGDEKMSVRYVLDR